MSSGPAGQIDGQDLSLETRIIYYPLDSWKSNDANLCNNAFKGYSSFMNLR